MSIKWWFAFLISTLVLAITNDLQLSEYIFHLLYNKKPLDTTH